jgi:hypothetical protein
MPITISGGDPKVSDDYIRGIAAGWEAGWEEGCKKGLIIGSLFSYFISIILIILLFGCTPEDDEPCVQAADTVYTELGIPVHVDRKYCPDLELTDEIYLSVCDCVNVNPIEFLGEFEIVIREPILKSKNRYSIGTQHATRIEVTENQEGLSHEIGHYFHWILIGYKHIKSHDVNSYEVLCDLEPP